MFTVYHTPTGDKSTKTEGYNEQIFAIKEKIKPETEAKVVDVIDEDYFPMSDIPNIKTYEVCYLLVSPNEISTGFMDLTGGFPQKSSQGHGYILVGYHYDSNIIYGIPIKNRKGSSLSEAWEQLN